jgi:hypothetical protein
LEVAESNLLLAFGTLEGVFQVFSIMSQLFKTFNLLSVLLPPTA